MGQRFLDSLVWLQEHQVHWYLAAVAAVLILVDYYFITDIAAHLAYLASGIAVFFWIPQSMLVSLLVGLATWLGLEVLHHTVFYRFLHNVPDPSRPPAAPVGGEPPSAVA